MTRLGWGLALLAIAAGAFVSIGGAKAQNKVKIGVVVPLKWAICSRWTECHEAATTLRPKTSMQRVASRLSGEPRSNWSMPIIKASKTSPLARPNG